MSRSNTPDMGLLQPAKIVNSQIQQLVRDVKERLAELASTSEDVTAMDAMIDGVFEVLDSHIDGFSDASKHLITMNTKVENMDTKIDKMSKEVSSLRQGLGEVVSAIKSLKGVSAGLSGADSDDNGPHDQLMGGMDDIIIPRQSQDIKRTFAERGSAVTSPQGTHQRPRIGLGSAGPSSSRPLFDLDAQRLLRDSSSPFNDPVSPTAEVTSTDVEANQPEHTPAARTTVSPDAGELEQIDDGYVSPNHADVRKTYVVINVSNPQRIQHSVLNAWIRAKYADSFDAFKAIMDTCLSRITREQTRRPQDVPNPPLCFVQQHHRRTGPLIAKGKAAERWRWNWPTHDTNKACPNVNNTSDPRHQCLKIADAHNLWLLNPLPEDFDNQERFDRENHRREIVEVSRAGQVSNTGEAEAGDICPVIDTPVDPQQPLHNLPSLGNMDLGVDGTYDTLELQSDRSSSPVFSMPQGHEDPPVLFTRRSKLMSSKAMKKITGTSSRLLKSISNLSLTSQSTSSVPAPMTTSLPQRPKNARVGLSKRSHNEASRASHSSTVYARPTSQYAVPLDYSVTDFARNDGATQAPHGSNTIRPMSVSSNRHTTTSRSSVVHSRNGSTVMATSHLPKLDEAGEESLYRDPDNIEH